jgi:Frag1/DRAM/Sfk1 family
MGSSRKTTLSIPERQNPMYESVSPAIPHCSDTHHVPVVSDIAADILKPLFIPVCVITAASFVLSLAMERWLRHVGRLPRNLRRREKIFAWLALCSALFGGVGLILLSIFDSKRHHKLHRVYLVRGETSLRVYSFVEGYTDTTVPRRSLYLEYPYRQHLRYLKCVVLMYTSLSVIA